MIRLTITTVTGRIITKVSNKARYEFGVWYISGESFPEEIVTEIEYTEKKGDNNV